MVYIPVSVMRWYRSRPDLVDLFSGVPKGDPRHPATDKSIIELYREEYGDPYAEEPENVAKYPSEFQFDKDIFLSTESPVALDNFDLIEPSGSTWNYTDAFEFASELNEVFNVKQPKVLDLGTATGMVPLTMRKAGMLSVGLEGSDIPKTRGLGAWDSMPGIVRCADISMPFEIRDADGKIVQFDYITSWGVFEHIKFERLDILFKNILKHLKDGGVLIANIDRGICEHHLTVLSWQEWRELLMKYFDIDEITLIAWDWHFPRPTPQEIRHAKNNYGRLATAKDGRTYWWCHKKRLA
jgi:hypothetical protein